MEIVAAFVAFRKRNGLRELLFLRARDTYYYTFPGDAQRLGEPIEQSLVRGLSAQGIVANAIRHIGTVNGQTSDGRIQILHMYSGEVGDTTTGQINGATWMDKTRYYLNHAFMTDSMLRHAIPYLEKEGHW